MKAKEKFLSYLTIPHLKDLCDKKDVKVSGTKPQLIERLLEANLLMEDLRVDELKAICEAQGKQATGNKMELLQRICGKSTEYGSPKPAKKKQKAEGPFKFGSFSSYSFAGPTDFTKPTKEPVKEDNQP